MKSNQSEKDGTAKAVPGSGPRGDGPHEMSRLVDAVARARLRLGRLATAVEHLASVGSTNDVAMQRSAMASAERRPAKRSSIEGLVVVADEQTAGRGRRGHTWFSPPGAGLYVSVVVTPAAARADPSRATMLTTLAAGVAVAEGIERATGLRADVKWPNDVHVSRRKLAGILAEGAGEAVVLGYGINLAAAALPPELRDRATSLETELGRPVDRAIVLVETLAALSQRYEDLLAGRFDAVLDAWRARAPAASGARVTWSSGADALSGITAGIDDRGALLVRAGDRIERIVSGEVTWL